ncbi:SH3 domain-binding protein 2 [Platysternon megacephalum]|uniref:SH3 domain-binding protein 2 n=1 Tax=Platysternon megacephalum TaxID=55544 RepID=A0A4D9EXX1_9SAUR|nr:SH3 domain-binding protein 2 [Platysternon megacephalum]
MTRPLLAQVLAQDRTAQLSNSAPILENRMGTRDKERRSGYRSVPVASSSYSNLLNRPSFQLPVQLGTRPLSELCETSGGWRQVLLCHDTTSHTMRSPTELVTLALTSCFKTVN